MMRSVIHCCWLFTVVGIGFVLFCLLLASGIGGSTILFYRGLVLAAVTALVAGTLGATIARRYGIAPLAVAAALSTFCVSACFLVLFPVTIDRSVSVYLLATIDRQGVAGMSKGELEGAFVDGYVREMGAIDRRIIEQRISGNIIEHEQGRVRLTERGRRFIMLSRSAARLLGTDPRFVEGHGAATRPTTAASPPQ